MSCKKALVAMSGGVDSSVAAYLMKAQGFDCIGCTMRLYDNEDIGISRSHTCCSLDDVEDARTVAYKLGMPYHVFNFVDGFHEKVINKFVQSYETGVTPNPCIDCNRFMKFDDLYRRAKILNCDYVVTGHYAKIEHNGEKYVLKKAIDETKDQSYVLYFMTQEQLAHTLFPLGNMKKIQTRKIASENGFINADKSDSQDICFVPDGDYAKAIERFSNKQASIGDFVDVNGNVIGRHKGIFNYTIGQRKGLGISSDKPLYVCDISAQNNTVTIGESQYLLKNELLAKDFNWISGELPSGEIKCKAKIRYRQKEQGATATLQTNGLVKITFDEPQRAITPGQAVVLYDEDIVLGGGIII